jgi:hypothetical protein
MGSQFFHRRNEGWAHAEAPQTHREEQQERPRLPSHFAAQSNSLVGSAARLDHHGQRLEHRWGERLAEVAHLGVVAVRGHQVLHQIVRTHGDKVYVR